MDGSPPARSTPKDPSFALPEGAATAGAGAADGTAAAAGPAGGAAPPPHAVTSASAPTAIARRCREGDRKPWPRMVDGRRSFMTRDSNERLDSLPLQATLDEAAQGAFRSAVSVCRARARRASASEL